MKTGTTCRRWHLQEFSQEHILADSRCLYKKWLCLSQQPKKQRVSNSISGQQKKKWHFLTIYHLKSGKKKHTPPLTFSRPKQTSSKIQKRGDTSPTPPTPNPSNLLGPDALVFSTTWVSHTWNWWVVGEEWWLILFGERAKKNPQNTQNAALLRFFSLKRCSLKLWINWINC